MATYQVTCHTPDNVDLDRRIQGLGGIGQIAGWWFPIDTIIYMIEQQGDVFWVDVFGVVTLVVVREHHGPYGRKYLTTIPDGFPPNNLLRLPHCPHV